METILFASLLVVVVVAVLWVFTSLIVWLAADVEAAWKNTEPVSFWHVLFHLFSYWGK